MRTAIIVYGEEEVERQAVSLIGFAEKLNHLSNEECETELFVIYFISNNEIIMPYDCEKAAVEFIQRYQIEAVITIGNVFGNELASRIACYIEGSKVLNVERIYGNSKGIAASRKSYASNLFAEVTLIKKPYILTIAEMSFSSKDKLNIKTQKISVKLENKLPAYCVSRKFVSESNEDNRLEEAEMVIAGGRGVGSKENTEKLNSLAERIDACLGSSRPPVLDAWSSHSRLIGASGKKIKPRLCLTFGISGAGPFMAGIEKSEIIAAINTDRNALIFNYCDYGVVADCKEAVDVLMSMVENIKEQESD